MNRVFTGSSMPEAATSAAERVRDVDEAEPGGAEPEGVRPRELDGEARGELEEGGGGGGRGIWEG